MNNQHANQDTKIGSDTTGHLAMHKGTALKKPTRGTMIRSGRATSASGATISHSLRRTGPVRRGQFDVVLESGRIIA
jgi:hypothetical protein